MKLSYIQRMLLGGVLDSHLNEKSNNGFGFYYEKINCSFSVTLKEILSAIDMNSTEFDKINEFPSGTTDRFLENKDVPNEYEQEDLAHLLKLNDVQQEALKRKVDYSRKKHIKNIEENARTPKNLSQQIKFAIRNGVNSANEFLNMLKKEWKEESTSSLARSLKINETTVRNGLVRNNLGEKVVNILKHEHNLSDRSFIYLNFISNSEKFGGDKNYSLNEKRLSHLPETEQYVRGLYDITKEYQKNLSQEGLTQKQKLVIGDEYFRKILDHTGVNDSKIELMTGVSHQLSSGRSISNSTQTQHFIATKKIFDKISVGHEWLSEMMIDTSFGLDKRYEYKEVIDALKEDKVSIGETIFIARTQNRMTTYDFAEKASCKPELVNKLEANEGFAVYPDVLDRISKTLVSLYGKEPNKISADDISVLKIKLRGGDNKPDLIKLKLEQAHEGKISSGEFVKFVLDTYNMSLDRMVDMIAAKGFPNPTTRGNLYKWSHDKAASIRSQAHAFAAGLGILDEEEIEKCCNVLQHKVVRYDPEVLASLDKGEIDAKEAFNKLFQNSHKTKEDIESEIGGKKSYFLTMQKTAKVPEEFVQPLMKAFGIEDEKDQKTFRKHFETDMSIHELRKLARTIRSDQPGFQR